MNEIDNLSDEELTNALAYAGLVLVAFELVKSLIVDPIKAFYKNTTFVNGPFKSYKEDVLSRDNNEFEACLLYLRDFMEAIDTDDVIAIQILRKHRNDLAHNLVNNLSHLRINENLPIIKEADKALFKLSNYQTYIEIGSDPKFKNKGINWDTIEGHEYLLFKKIVNKIKLFQDKKV